VTGRVAAHDHLDEVEVERRHDDARVRAVSSHAAERLCVAVPGAARVRIRGDARLDSVAAPGVGFDRKERREQRDPRDLEGRRVGVERVEPRVPRLGRQRLVRQGRGHGRLGIRCQRRQPASPRGLHVIRDRFRSRGFPFLAKHVVLIAGHQNSEP
jgi:hypothetical protein